MTDTENQTALAMLGLLERRLQQVEFLLSGTDKAGSTLQGIVKKGPDGTITARLEQIEKRFNNLSSDSPVIYDLLKLCGFFVLQRVGEGVKILPLC